MQVYILNINGARMENLLDYTRTTIREGQELNYRGIGGSMKNRITVNKVKISYNEKTDEITFQKDGKNLILKMGEDQLNLLYQMTPYYNYKKFLLMEQDFRCADCKKSLEGLKAKEYALHHDPKLGSKGSKYIDFDKKTKNRILCNLCHGKIKETTRTPSSKMILERLLELGYKQDGTRWKKGQKTVNVVSSSQFGEKVRISWKDDWKNDYATIFDYSSGNGPVCIIPISNLFASEFVMNKRKAISYANSKYRWTQLFPKHHDLVRFLLTFRDRWDIL